VMRWSRLEASQTVNYRNAPLFNISSEEVEKIYKPILKHPIIFGIFEVTRQFLHYFKGGLLFSGLLTWKVALLDLFRKFVTHYYIYVYRKK
nr:hypothetical protein [Patescibacteria group bacterium]